MANLKSDSPTSRRIVRAFLDFLTNVEPAPGVDLEGLEVARECLQEVFKLDSFPDGDQTKPDLLVDIFSSLATNTLQDNKSDLGHGSISRADVPRSSLTQNCAEDNLSKTSKSSVEDVRSEAHTSGAFKDELFGQFFAALEKIDFFRTMPDGTDDPVGIEKATRLFHDALIEMERSGCQEYNTKNLAETLKSQGNRAMQSKLYSDAIQLYNCAIALFENNAIYYCNRAAAYTQIHKYNEAVRDCLKSIEIDTSYSKAYSRLGLAYYAQGNYSDAINKGFKKALQLDPNNEAVKENIRMAEQKIKETQQTEHDRSASSSSQSDSDHHNQSAGGPRSHGAPPPFTSMPFNTTGLPADFANMFMNMSTNAYHQGQHSQNRQGNNSNADGFDDPGIQIGGNINLNFGEQMPEELTGALRSVMEMFSGAAPHGNSHDNASGGSAPQN
ncbi:uncharacterized protein LOC133804853 isoform X2 [Humulus lupulus]|uniref:uncharacterized protein LOC133804853 isoform X2 n=1 Tax=Humulus lupulus TaxID=3486 RepID=UPI002B412F99|nr:uncharacterized protein LOC133804853 isoform X2 [Humulus lupulus]